MIDNMIYECDQCQREGKSLGSVAPLQTIKVSAVWELLGPFPKTTDGYQYIFTATDYFSNSMPFTKQTSSKTGGSF
uniref:Uncharacterized protein n=1 Tax=Knipowitschia caucasica TaxID=637954 RepID=A0AAV2M9A1_KNICA